jgi:hypothetical protein
MLFRDTTGDPKIEAMHREVAAGSRAAIMGLFADQPEVEKVIGPEVEQGLEMAWIVMRGVLQGLAMWWYEHPEVPRERVVATAMNALWVGWERTQAGESWG